jgi:hypothetical protein
MNSRRLAWRLVSSALFGRDFADRTALDTLLRSPGLSWPHVIELAGNHYVTPSLWIKLVAAHLDTAIPAEARKYLHAVYQFNRRRNAALLAQIDEAIEALNGAGVAPLLLKGAAYLKLAIHADPGARVAADIDMLVPVDAVETARRALENIGYAASPSCASRTHHHLAPLVREGGAGPVELHVAAVAEAAQHVLPTAAAWLHSVEHASGKFRVLSPSHMVLHRFVHDQIIDRYHALRTIALRSLLDLVALDAHYGSAVDWDGIREAAERAGCPSILKDYLYVARRTAGLALPRDMAYGPREAAYFCACESAIRWDAVRMGFGVLDAMSAFWITKQYGPAQTFGSMNGHRVRILADILRSKWSRAGTADSRRSIA